MSQSWEQALVDADVEVSRAMFEMNRPGEPVDAPWYKPEADLRYIEAKIREAIELLRESLTMLPGAQQPLFPEEIAKLDNIADTEGK
jgi:hypothetical protein